MKILLKDKSYYEGTKTFEMVDDSMGGDFALMVEYLHAYSVDLQQKIQSNGNSLYAFAWQAKVDEMKRIAEKYKKLIEFVQYVDGEETAL